MTVLPNPKHELFAQGIALGKTQSQAYVDAGYTAGPGVAPNAARLITDDKVLSRVRELQEAAAVKTGITVEWWLRNVKEVAEDGAQRPQALRLAADYLGIGKEITGEGANKPLDSESFAAALSEGRERLRLVGGNE